MSKKTVEMEYLNPLEFVSFYLKKGYEKDKKELEKTTGKSILELITIVVDDEEEFFNLLDKIENFANGCGYSYCGECNIFYEYLNCPFCFLDIDL